MNLHIVQLAVHTGRTRVLTLGTLIFTQSWSRKPRKTLLTARSTKTCSLADRQDRILAGHFVRVLGFGIQLTIKGWVLSVVRQSGSVLDVRPRSFVTILRTRSDQLNIFVYVDQPAPAKSGQISLASFQIVMIYSLINSSNFLISIFSGIIGLG